jgi:hypothetical protein
VTKVNIEVIGLRENRSIKWTKADRRKITRREEKLTIKSTKGGETGKNTELGRNHKPLGFDKFM